MTVGELRKIFHFTCQSSLLENPVGRFRGGCMTNVPVANKVIIGNLEVGESSTRSQAQVLDPCQSELPAR